MRHGYRQVFSKVFGKYIGVIADQSLSLLYFIHPGCPAFQIKQHWDGFERIFQCGTSLINTGLGRSDDLLLLLCLNWNDI